MAKYDFLDGERVRKAHSVRSLPPVFQNLATSLARIPDLRYIKIFPDRIAASNVLSADGKKNPVVIIGSEGIVGVELLVDVPNKICSSTRSPPRPKAVDDRWSMPSSWRRPKTGFWRCSWTGVAASGKRWLRSTRDCLCAESCR
jgi:hypothetical protein